MLRRTTGVVLFVITQAIKETEIAQQNQRSDTYIWIGMAAFLFGLYLIDRRNNHECSRALRGYIGELIVRFRSRKRIRGQLREKIAIEEPPPTPKNYASRYDVNLSDDLPVTSDSVKQEVVLPEQIKSDSPEPDFKGVFKVKETKCKHKINKKSKSKLKGRLLGKGSDGEEVDPAGEGEGSGLMEENSFEKSGEIEEYQTIENLE